MSSYNALSVADMELTQLILELRAQKQAVERTIECLEALAPIGANPLSNSPAAPRRRGRRSMDAREREDVSKRMKKYWANRHS
jgi:hypothetical protein